MTVRRRVTEMQPGESVRLEKVARNAATDSENKIHDDAEARRLGLRGGLVPGVALYAHLTELALPLLGPDWLRHGTASVRFVKPVYEGEAITCTAIRGDAAAGDDGSVLELAVLNAMRATCVIGLAALSPGGDAAEATNWQYGEPPPDTGGDRLPLTREIAPLGLALRPRVILVDAEAVESYAAETDDATPWYRGGSPFGLPIVPPGLLAGQPARLLRQNFDYGPSVHTNSEIQHLALPLAGGTYTINAALLETFTRGSHDYLTADVLIRDHTDRPVMRIRHTVIFRFAART